MFRPIRRSWRRLLTARARAALLLVTWAASVVLTTIHDDGGGKPQSRAPASTAMQRAAHHQARGARVDPRLANHESALTAPCGGAGDCHDPNHHHRPLAHHDVAQCPFCAMLLERPAELPLFVFEPPTTVRFVVAGARLPLSPSERHVFALARGPPPAAAPV